MKRKTVYQTLEQRKSCLLTCYSAACSVAKMKRKTVYQTPEQRKSAACSVAKMKRKTVYQTLEHRKSCLLFSNDGRRNLQPELEIASKINTVKASCCGK
jgi:hypothetical protein